MMVLRFCCPVLCLPLPLSFFSSFKSVSSWNTWQTRIRCSHFNLAFPQSFTVRTCQQIHDICSCEHWRKQQHIDHIWTKVDKSPIEPHLIVAEHGCVCVFPKKKTSKGHSWKYSSKTIPMKSADVVLNLNNSRIRWFANPVQPTLDARHYKDKIFHLKIDQQDCFQQIIMNFECCSHNTATGSQKAGTGWVCIFTLHNVPNWAGCYLGLGLGFSILVSVTLKPF